MRTWTKSFKRQLCPNGLLNQLEIFRSCSKHQELPYWFRFFKNIERTKSYSSKPLKIKLFDFLVCKMHKFYDDVIKLFCQVLWPIIIRFPKFEHFFKKKNTEVIKDQEMFFFVNHVIEKLLTSAAGGHMDLKFCQQVPK